MLVSMKGRIPNFGSAAVDAHVFPKRNGMSPISAIAGTPEIIRYRVISSTQLTVTSPNSRKTP